MSFFPFVVYDAAAELKSTQGDTRSAPLNGESISSRGIDLSGCGCRI